MENRPMRLQLSRRKGFDLQAMSVKYNGRCAANVARPSKFGNPFTVTTKIAPGSKIAAGAYHAVPTVADAIACFEEYLQHKPELMAAVKQELAGHNLACWCKPNEPCHADVLLKIANT